MTDIRVSRIGGPITVLGPGRRVALWVQGCTIGCAGCASMDTWLAHAGARWAVPELADELLRMADVIDATGLSVSGGEPFQQAGGLASVLAAVRSGWSRGEPDILIFTGYAATVARRRSPALWAEADIIIAGPYLADRPSSHPLLGSDNQTIELLTSIGEQRMSQVETARRPIQVAMQEGRLVMVGMPDPGDLDRIRVALEAKGVSLGAASWKRPGGSG